MRIYTSTSFPIKPRNIVWYINKNGALRELAVKRNQNTWRSNMYHYARRRFRTIEPISLQRRNLTYRAYRFDLDIFSEDESESL